MSKLKVRDKMKKAIFCIAIIALSGASVADNQILASISEVMSQSCLANRRVARSVYEWGVPQKLITEPSFTNLVRIVGLRVDLCDLSFVRSLTNTVQREVFKTALANCGQTVYRDVVIRWFGGALVPAVQPQIMEEFAVPANTSMEWYFINHYDEAEIRNVWMNIKARYLAIGEADEAAGIDEVLSGNCNAEHQMRQSLESR